MENLNKFQLCSTESVRYYSFILLEPCIMNSQKIEPGKILLAKNIKPTPIRLKVLETLLSQTHAMRLYDIENILDGVERTSIFRAIKNFEKNNLVHEIDDGSGATKFALCEDRCECNWKICTFTSFVRFANKLFVCNNCRFLRWNCLRNLLWNRQIL
jgi:Fe2+ or Zn2+ uptake regulation protein